MNFLRSLGAVLIHPRPVMRRLLEGRGHRFVPLLVLLAICSSVLSDTSRAEMTDALETGPVGPIVAAVIVLSIVIMILLFYALAWVAVLAGRMLEGEGNYRDVRTALAWGLAPIVVALVYRLPVFLLKGPDERTRVTLTEGLAFSVEGMQTCGPMLLLGFMEVLVLVWFVTVASNTLGEAHRFSSWRGLATLLLTLASPVIIVIAAVLASHS